MARPESALRSTAIRAAAGLHVALASILCFLPLFDTLGFERAFATGLLTTITSPMIAASLLRRARATQGDDPGRIAARALGISLLLLVPTAVAGWLVEALAQPCDQQSGLLFLLLLAGGNAAFGSALGVLVAGLTPRRGVPIIATVLVLAGFLGAALVRVYNEPQIFAYSVPFGFWPGSLYDEELSVSSSLWAFRAYTLLYALALAAAARALMDRRTLLLTTRPRLIPLAATVGLAVGAWATHEAGGKLGFDLDRDSVKAALSLRLTTEHFEIYVDPSIDKVQAERLRTDHELRWAQLRRFFATAPEGRITSFVYRDTKQKAALMGAGRTQIARPWAHEIHIHGFDVPHRVLKHELAHIFAGALAEPPFRVPTRLGVFVNIGIVEGVAVAADWPTRELTVHGWTRAMRALSLAPDMRRTLSPAGFWSVSSSRAYTVAGSFVRYLFDTYGIDKLGLLYRDNDFLAAYGRPLGALVSEWEAYIDALPLPKEELVLAEHRFSYPSIFQKVCAHQAANLARRGQQRLGAGDLEGGTGDLETLLGYRRSDPGPLVTIANAYARDGQLDRAHAYLERAAAVPGATQKALATVREGQGNLAWRRGDLSEARAAYSEVSGLHLSTPSDRLQQARLTALERDEAVQAILREYLLMELPLTRALVRLGDLADAHPDDTLVQYLYGRTLELAQAYPEGVEAQRRSLSGVLPGEAITTEAQLALGRMLLWAGSATTAAAHFRGLAEGHPKDVVRSEARDWWARCHFVIHGDLIDTETSTRAGAAPGK